MDLLLLMLHGSRSLSPQGLTGGVGGGGVEGGDVEGGGGRCLGDGCDNKKGTHGS